MTPTLLFSVATGWLIVDAIWTVVLIVHAREQRRQDILLTKRTAELESWKKDLIAQSANLSAAIMALRERMRELSKVPPLGKAPDTGEPPCSA